MIALRARNQMFAAVNAILVSDQESLRIEEMQPFRDVLTSNGLKISEDILRDLPGDPRSRFVRLNAMLARAKLLAEKGDRDQASVTLREAIAFCRGQLKEEPTSLMQEITWPIFCASWVPCPRMLTRCDRR